MKRRNKILLILPLLFMAVTDIFCQHEKINADLITQRLSEYIKAVPYEDIYVHTDRESYTAGESVWFRVYLSDRGTGKLSEESSYAYVEVLDSYSRPVAQTKTLLEKGTGTTILELPDTLVNGSYTLRAYTNRMKSFMPLGCFMKKITVVNPFSTRFINFRLSEKQNDEKAFRIDFYPEGGKLVAGVPCRLGVTVLNKYGIPVRCNGVIKSDEGEIIAAAEIDSSGIGSLMITSAPGSNLYFEPDGTGDLFTLPPVSETGSLIRVLRNDRDSLVLSLLTSFNPGTPLTLVIESRGIITYRTGIQVHGMENIINLGEEVLVAGINDLALFDASGMLLSERLVLKQPVKEAGLRAECSPVYSRREKVKIDIVNDGRHDPLNDLTDLSISVALRPEGLKNGGADEYLITGTEYILPGQGSILPEIFSSLSAEKKDILLLGTKSLWINWSDIMTSSWKRPAYPFEKDGQYTYVSFFNQEGVPVEKGSMSFLSIPGKTAEFQYSVADSTGRSCFFMTNSSQVKDLVLQPADTSGSYSAKIEDKFSEKYPLSVFVHDTARAFMPEGFATLTRNFQVQKIYENITRGESIIPPPELSSRPRFYGKPDQELVMDDYIALSTMREVFFELVRKVSVRTNRRENSFMLYDPVLKRNPALFIDGVPIDDAAKILNLNPAHVEQIDVILSDYRVGDLIFPGIINVTTRTGAYRDIPLPKNAVRISLKMFDEPWAFISREYPTDELKRLRTPDFRNTLFWNAGLRSDPTGKSTIEFWTSDHSGEYLIDLEGISSSGKVVSVRKAITVE